MTPIDPITSAEVTHNPAAAQFELRVAEYLCLLQYRLTPGRMIIYHTEVPQAIGGRGLAERMTQAAMEFARKEKLRVEPRCSYAAAYLQKHPEYRDLLG